MADLPIRSAEGWAEWAKQYHMPINFPSKHRWRRTVRATGRLDVAHRQAKSLLTAGWHPADSAHGFVRRRSTMTAAAPHVGSKIVLAIDLADFYGQVSFDRVSESLRAHFDESTCAWIEGTCFLNGALPVGFRTSPVLSNRAFHEMDLELESLARRNDVRYSRWVDDLIFSGDGVNDDLLERLGEELSASGWSLNSAKTRFMRRSPYVLGLYVGHDADRPRLPRRMKQRLLVESYYFSKYGYAHFGHEGVMAPGRLFGLASYAKVADPELAKLLDVRIVEGYRVTRSQSARSGARAR
ncbi:reverse transcriptase family protein [Plantibacter sp. YIM 135249]|uniref:reverse transcriptase family protein n=1 Tax=Plantibacter sp. YIM 135249 TaxID=3423918 RepID=UPI003D339DF8